MLSLMFSDACKERLIKMKSQHIKFFSDSLEVSKDKGHVSLPVHCWFLCLCDCTEAMQQLKLQLADSDRRITSYVRKLNKMQVDYYNLIGITAELVDTLEATASGKMVSRPKQVHILSDTQQLQ